MKKIDGMAMRTRVRLDIIDATEGIDGEVYGDVDSRAPEIFHRLDSERVTTGIKIILPSLFFNFPDLTENNSMAACLLCDAGEQMSSKFEFEVDFLRNEYCLSVGGMAAWYVERGKVPDALKEYLTNVLDEGKIICRELLARIGLSIIEMDCEFFFFYDEQDGERASVLTGYDQGGRLDEVSLDFPVFLDYEPKKIGHNLVRIMLRKILDNLDLGATILDDGEDVYFEGFGESYGLEADQAKRTITALKDKKDISLPELSGLMGWPLV